MDLLELALFLGLFLLVELDELPGELQGTPGGPRRERPHLALGQIHEENLQIFKELAGVGRVLLPHLDPSFMRSSFPASRLIRKI